MNRGKLIVFEGISGTGKETQAKLLQAFLEKKGIISHIVFHPAPELKPVLRKAASVSMQIELLAQNRGDTVKKVIGPAILRGEWVISLRNYVSAMVYQADRGIVKNIDVQPDYLFYFDIDPEISMSRITSRGEAIGMYETMKLLQEKRNIYKNVLKKIPHITIDGSKSIDATHRTISSWINRENIL